MRLRPDRTWVGYKAETQGYHGIQRAIHPLPKKYTPIAYFTSYHEASQWMMMKVKRRKRS